MKLIQDLIPSDRKLLEDIMRKEAAALTESDKAVIKARRDYISDSDYAKLMGTQEKVKVQKDKVEK